MSVFADDYAQESPTFRRTVQCYRCKTSKYLDEMVVKELKSSRGSRGGDSIMICGNCNKGEKTNG